MRPLIYLSLDVENLFYFQIMKGHLNKQHRITKRNWRNKSSKKDLNLEDTVAI